MGRDLAGNLPGTFFIGVGAIFLGGRLLLFSSSCWVSSDCSVFSDISGGGWLIGGGRLLTGGG